MTEFEQPAEPAELTLAELDLLPVGARVVDKDGDEYIRQGADSGAWPWLMDTDLTEWGSAELWHNYSPITEVIDPT